MAKDLLDRICNLPHSVIFTCFPTCAVVKEHPEPSNPAPVKSKSRRFIALPSLVKATFPFPFVNGGPDWVRTSDPALIKRVL